MDFSESLQMLRVGKLPCLEDPNDIGDVGFFEVSKLAPVDGCNEMNTSVFAATPSLPRKKASVYLGSNIMQGDSAKDFISQVHAIKAYADQVLPPGRSTLRDLYMQKTIKPWELFDGKLVSCTSPTEFSVITQPAWSYKEKNSVWNIVPEPHDPLEGKVRLNGLLKAFFAYHGSFSESSTNGNFADEELVAVMHNHDAVSRLKGSTAKWQCYRGVIIPEKGWKFFISESNEVPQRNKETICTDNKMYGVYLFDQGTFLKVPASHLQPLPTPFSELAPMAIRCTLNKISPVGREWSSIATTFMKMVLCDQIIGIQSHTDRYANNVPWKRIAKPLPVEILLSPYQRSKTTPGPELDDELEIKKKMLKSIFISELLIENKLGVGTQNINFKVHRQVSITTEISRQYMLLR